MTERGRREYPAVIRARYGQADKRERGRLLTEYCRTTGCHRKAAIRRLRRAPRPPGRAPGRPARYVARELVPILEQAWLASDQLSGKLLRSILPGSPDGPWRRLMGSACCRSPRPALTVASAFVVCLLRMNCLAASGGLG